ncbi:MAG: hypothetical protein WCI05_18180 [Myxococcales bacterium]
MERLCVEPGIGTTFPVSCASPDGSLVQLRTNLLRDIGRMGEEQLRRSGVSDSPQVKWATQILELVDLTLLSPDLLTRSLRDGFGRGLPDEHYENIAEEVVKSRSPALARQLAALLREIEELTLRLRDSPQPTAASIVTPLVLKNLEALRDTWLIATVGQRTPEFPLRPELFAEVQPLVTAIMTCDWNRIVTAVRPQLETLEAQQVLPRGSVHAFDSAARLASAQTEDDLKRAARDLVLPLPPWMDHWVAEVIASWPRLETADFLLNGDLTLGYPDGTV